ncbi:HAMP domain-containing protein [Shigella flexneri]
MWLTWSKTIGFMISPSAITMPHSQAMWILVGVMIVVLAVIFAVWFGIKASLVAPMNRLIDSIRHIAGGDLVKPIEVDGSNEMGQLAESLRHMQES